MNYEKIILDMKEQSGGLIYSNYKYFYEEIEKLTPKERTNLFESIRKLEIVAITLDPSPAVGDNPQLVFESLNSTGVELENTDKIRNFILLEMGAEDQRRCYQEYWQPIEKMVTRKHMDDFIRYYLAVLLKKVITKSKVYSSFKHLIHAGNSISVSSFSPREVLKNMKEFAEYYHEIQSPMNSPFKKCFKHLMMLQVNTSIPFLMVLLQRVKHNKITKEKAQKILEIVESYVVRRTICGLPTNALNKVFPAIAAAWDRNAEKYNGDYYKAFCKQILNFSGKTRFPTNEDLERAFTYYDLYNATPAVKKYILERLENWNESEQRDNKELIDVFDLVDEGVLTIEHIMPQTLSDEWKQELGVNWELIHRKYVNTIGNLTLTAYNSTYSNSPFKVKRDLPEKGFKSSKLRLNDSVKTCDKWGELEILYRAGLLLNKALGIWWMPSMDHVGSSVGRERPQSYKVRLNSQEEEPKIQRANVTPQREGLRTYWTNPKPETQEKDSYKVNSESRRRESSGWYCWDDDFSPTGMEILEVVLLGVSISTESTKDAYGKVHAQLRMRYPEVYDSNTYSWLSDTGASLRRPYKVGDYFYLESNSSNVDKVTTIKKIAQNLGLKSEDIRFRIEPKAAKRHRQ